MAGGLSSRSAAVLLAAVVLSWGTNWPATKMIVLDVTPLWATALRCMVAAAALAPLLWAQGDFIIPRRGDLPVVFCTSILHLVAFSSLVAAGLQFVPAGRAIVLGYTTPLWVAIGAAMFLSEEITRRRAIGIGFGLAGLAVIFNPQTLNWGDRNALFGSGLILVAAFCWAGNIVYVRAHRWISTPFNWCSGKCCWRLRCSRSSRGSWKVHRRLFGQDVYARCCSMAELSAPRLPTGR
jgi:drug/metabolite transporter (DMT)-like permease